MSMLSIRSQQNDVAEERQNVGGPEDNKSAMRRALIVGVGHMGGLHARVLSQIENVEIVAAVDPSEEQLRKFERAHAGVSLYGGVDEALDGTQIDFACLATPAGELARLGHCVVDRRVPLMIEKPVAANEEDALALVDYASRCNVMLGVGHVERCNPAVMALKEKLDSGMIGRIYQLYARRLSPFPDRDSLLGVALDLASHDIDVMRYLTGSEIDRVYAETAQRLHDNAEDLLAATMRFDNGTTGLLEVNWLTPAKVRELTVTGEGGTFVLNYLTQELYHYSHPTEPTSWDTLANMRGAGEGDMIRFALARREPLLVQWEAFLDALDGDPYRFARGYDGYAALSTAKAIQHSGEHHEVVQPRYRHMDGT